MRRRKEKVLFAFLVILLLSSLATVFIPSGFASSETRVYVDPSSIIDQALTPPNTFTVNVTLANVTNLFGFEYKFFWDPTLINLTSYTTHIPSGWESPNGFTVKDDTTVAGRHWYSYTCLTGSPFTGDLTLATYTFEALGIGSCLLDLQDTKPVDNSATVILHSAEDGYFDNRQSSSISISASPTTMALGENTTISGSITPTREGANVTIYYRLTGEVMWNMLTTELTDATSHYSHVWTPTTVGIYETKTSWPGDTTTLPAESLPQLITVEGPPPPPPALIFVDPQKIVNITLVPCESFAVNISVINAAHLYSFEFKLGFAPDILNITGATLGNIFPPVTPIMEINNTAGYIGLSASLEPPQSEVSGNGTLATITFHVEGLGVCELALYDTVLADEAAELLPHSTSDGYFNNVLLAQIFVDPPSIIDPTLLPPSTFTINISIANVTDMYDYVFKLGYDTNILNCLGIDIFPFNDETHFTPIISMNDAAGSIYVNVTYFDPAMPITTTHPATFVAIRFQVVVPGSTILELYDTHLSDPAGALIPHNATSGFLSILTRDVAILSVEPSKDATYTGWPVNITVVAANEGEVTETFNVSAYYDDNPIGTQTVTDLPPGGNETLVFLWNTAGVQPCINYTIKAEADAVPYEMDTADNVYIDGTVKIKMLGDINGDGIIDLQDIALEAIAFGSAAEDKPQTPWNETNKWNPEADLNGDGIVDIVDLVIVGINFGKTC